LSQLEFFHLQPGDPPIRDYRDCMTYPFVSLPRLRGHPVKVGHAALAICS
jgi:hypothetical protein